MELSRSLKNKSIREKTATILCYKKSLNHLVRYARMKNFQITPKVKMEVGDLMKVMNLVPKSDVRLATNNGSYDKKVQQTLSAFLHFFPDNPYDFCRRLDDETVAIIDKMLEGKCITSTQHKNVSTYRKLSEIKLCSLKSSLRKTEYSFLVISFVTSHNL